MVHRILLGIDVAAALVAVAFFVIGIADGSVSSFNLGIWLALLGAIVGLLVAGRALHHRGKPRLANGVLSILAVPTAVYALFILIIVVTQPRWN